MKTILTGNVATSSSRFTVSKDSWLLVAILSFAVAGYFGPPDKPGLHMATIAAMVGFTGAAASLLVSGGRPTSSWRQGLLVVAGFVGIRISEPFVTGEMSSATRSLMVFWIPLVLGLGCAAAAVLLRKGRNQLAALSLALVIAAFGSILILGFETPAIDVLLVHEAAAEAVRQGGSPYAPAVTVPDTSPYAPAGHSIVGYPYPPVAAFGYVLGVLALGDPRWLSVILLGASVVSLAHGPKPTDIHLRPASLLLVALPGIPIVVFLGFTEPLTLLLFTLCLMTWHDRPWVAAVLGGLALASKQYMLVAAPILLVAAYRRDRKHAAVMVLAGLATVLPNVIVDGRNLVQATVTNLASIPVRPDGSSLQALLLNTGSGLRIPLAVSLGVPIVVSCLLALRTKSRRDIATSACLTLTMFFLLGSVAFLNYWFLVAGIAVLAYALPNNEGTPAVAARGRRRTSGSAVISPSS